MYPRFYCIFDPKHIVLDFNPTNIWPVSMEFGKQLLVPIDKIAFPVLHIKLGLLQKFVKSLDKGSDWFKFICRNIKKSETKLNNSVFTGPKIRLLVTHQDFPKTMTDKERAD